MATASGSLQHGLQIGETIHDTYEIREATAGDVIEAMEESEKVVLIPGGDRPEPALVLSPTMVGLNTLRRQIVSVGTYQGPLTLGELKRLHPSDLDLLQKEAERLESTPIAAEAASRGRDDGGGGGH